MKKILSFMIVMLCACAFTSCISKEDEPEVSTGIEDDGTGRTPTRSELIGKWQSNEYQGWEPRLEQNVVIARELNLSDDGTYTNRYRGHLTQAKDGSELSTTEFGNWEEERGTWTYNESTAEISYVPNFDERVNYETTKMESYEYSNYKEKCLIKTSGTYNGMWITLDTYLKRSGNKGDLRYAVSKK